MLLLTIALFVDGLINIARIVEVERGMRLQARWLNHRDEELVQIIKALTGEPSAPEAKQSGPSSDNN